MIEIKFFAHSKTGICGADFNNRSRSELINLSYVVSVSDVRLFDLPFSGQHVGEYVQVKMHDGSYYYLSKDHGIDLRNKILGIKAEIQSDHPKMGAVRRV